MSRKNCILMCFICLMSVFLSFPASAEEGVTDTEIRIGSFGPLTGPAKLWGGVLWGVDLAFDQVNQEGGIHGRKIVHYMVDDSYNPAKTKAGVKQLHDSVGIFGWVAGVGTSCSKAVLDYFDKGNVPYVGPFSGAKEIIVPPKRSVFGIYMPYSVAAEKLCTYAVKNMGKERIAVVYLNDSFGLSGLQSVEQAMAKLGKPLAAAIAVDVKSADLKPATLELKKSNADAVLLWTDPFKALRILAIANQMKFDTQWMASQSLSDFPSMYKVSRGLIEGLIADLTIDYGNPYFDKFKALLKTKKYKDVKWGAAVVGGIIHAEYMVEGLKRCGPNLTRDNFIKAMETIDNMVVGGGIPVSYKPFDPNDPQCRDGRYKSRTVALQQCLKGGESKILVHW